jgi:hypothetical protein
VAPRLRSTRETPKAQRSRETGVLSLSVWAGILGICWRRFGDDAVAKMLMAAGRGSPEQAIQSVLQVPAEQLERDWHRSLSEQYGIVLQRTQLPSASARTIVAAKPGAGSINVSPSLSPDGTQVVVFSQRDVFSIELYLADAANRKVIKTFI